MIRYRWESRVEQAIYNMTGRSLGKSGTQWLTHLEVWLNPAGDVIATKILKESGIKLFDSAGVEAFREAKVFSNPPKELVESDGVIRIRYGFNVNWNPSALVLKHD